MSLPRMKEHALLDVIASGEALLREERQAFFAGRFGAIESIAARKRSLLEVLEVEVPQAAASAALRGALGRLVAQSRQNERIILAARSGLSAARRRIEAIEATRRGDVAYAPDGSRIVSRADGEKQNRRA